VPVEIREVKTGSVCGVFQPSDLTHNVRETGIANKRVYITVYSTVYNTVYRVSVKPHPQKHEFPEDRIPVDTKLSGDPEHFWLIWR
jgi:activator of 2-hydroxyglutaryl-CoA dehydratase